MRYGVAVVLLVFFVAGAPAVAAAADLPAQAGPQALKLSAKAQVEGTSVPLSASVSTENTDFVLSATKKDGSTPVTFTLYLTPKPKPAPVATSSSAAAAVESSSGIQQGIAGVSPQTASTLVPFFTLVDGGRSKAADVLDSQIANTKKNLGPDAGAPSEVLSAQDVKQAGQNPMGAFWYILQTLYLYLLTLLRFIVGSAGVFYPALAVAFLYILWKLFRRFRRPAY